jgi:phage-related tail protein
MTTHYAAARPLTGYQDHTIVGTPAHIANVLANHTRTGTLVAATAPRAAKNPADARVTVHVRLRTPAESTTARPIRPRLPRRTRRLLAAAVTATTAVIGVITAVAYLIGALVEFVTAHAAQLLGALTVLAVLAALIGSRRTGRHCPGC